MNKPFLSIIIPCYKEAKNLETTWAVFEKFATSQNYPVELIFVDDGSPDNTAEVLQKLTAGKDFCQAIIQDKNHGKGFAVKTGMLKATGDWRLFADADNATPIEQVEKLLAYKDKFEVMIGSRYLEEGHLKKKQPLYRILGGRFLNFFFKIFTGLKIKDSQCGFKLFSAKAAQEIFPRQTFARFSFDIEILTIAKFLGYQIAEVPVDWFARTKGTVNPIRDGIRFLWALKVVRWNLIRGLYKKPVAKMREV